MSSEILTEKILRDASPAVTFSPTKEKTNYTHCDFHPIGNCLLSICTGALNFFDITTGTPLSSLPTCAVDTGITCATWASGRDSPIATNIVVNNSSNNIDLYDMRTGKVSLRFSDCHSKAIRKINRGGPFSHHWYTFSSDGADGQVCIWDVRAKGGRIGRIKVKSSDSGATSTDSYVFSSGFNCDNTIMSVGMGHSVKYYISDVRYHEEVSLGARTIGPLYHYDGQFKMAFNLFKECDYTSSLSRNILSMTLSPTEDNFLSVCQIDTRDVVVFDSGTGFDGIGKHEMAYKCCVNDHDLYRIYDKKGSVSSDSSLMECTIDVARGYFMKKPDIKVKPQTFNTCFSPNEKFVFCSSRTDGVICFELGKNRKPKAFRLGQYHPVKGCGYVQCHPSHNIIAAAGAELSIFTPGI
ncbi:hypothetical protein ADUPG1_008296 [Aduncisulcus paluster]|uniref:Uncharacterized protein n=1 Tax=Aduncisulcus paluster TaxID=2918883 RepID=A0ABQ5KRF5_9EUKA|nr:hypothetical protein ADUPG1_008296 [Aduncisulcus paluster]